MSFSVPTEMMDILRLTKTGNLIEATAAIQRALRGGLGQADDATHPVALDATQTSAGVWTTVQDQPSPSAPVLPVAFHGMVDRFSRHGHQPAAPVALPDGAQFEQRLFQNASGSRPYKLYIPSGYAASTKDIPLIVMLHGCTQSADDFAAGTRMNDLAEEEVFLVAYPEQIQSANPSRCWNWFNAAEQQRSGSEASLIAGITRQIVAEFRVDPKRVFIAGLSAGGAAATIMGASYPDLYAAVGVHSGLACGAARDMPSAFVAMRKGGHRGSGKRESTFVPTIVFHGDADKTVHSINGEQVISQSISHATIAPTVEHGRSPGGVSYTRKIWRDAAANTHSEQWLLHGTGHAWSGGSASGSYTDPRGPDASREMIRFFLSNPMRRTPA
jgi:poly(hydroxyalkanoate) depolymerase family esterase